MKTDHKKKMRARAFIMEDEIIQTRLFKDKKPVPPRKEGHAWVVQKPYRDQCRAIGIDENFTLPLVIDTCPVRGKGWTERASCWNVDVHGYINWKGQP